jgi:hypothetical protein
MADLANPNQPSYEPDDNLSRLLITQLEEPWYHSLAVSIRELIHPAKLPPLQLTSKSVAVVETGLEQPWYTSLIQNVKDLIHPPKLAPLDVTSKPIPVKDIWGLYGRQKKSFMMSTGFQVTVVAVVFALGVTKQGQKMITKMVPIFAPVDLTPVDAAPKKQVMQGGGGGGDRSALPASFGKLPKASMRQFTPPVAVYNNMNPKLAMEPSIIAPPDTPLPQVNSAAPR